MSEVAGCAWSKAGHGAPGDGASPVEVRLRGSGGGALVGLTLLLAGGLAAPPDNVLTTALSKIVETSAFERVLFDWERS